MRICEHLCWEMTPARTRARLRGGRRGALLVPCRRRHGQMNQTRPVRRRARATQGQRLGGGVLRRDEKQALCEQARQMPGWWGWRGSAKPLARRRRRGSFWRGSTARTRGREGASAGRGYALLLPPLWCTAAQRSRPRARIDTLPRGARACPGPREHRTVPHNPGACLRQLSGSSESSSSREGLAPSTSPPPPRSVLVSPGRAACTRRLPAPNLPTALAARRRRAGWWWWWWCTDWDLWSGGARWADAQGVRGMAEAQRASIERDHRLAPPNLSKLAPRSPARTAR